VLAGIIARFIGARRNRLALVHTKTSGDHRVFAGDES
jgi:hypothetical protein